MRLTCLVSLAVLGLVRGKRFQSKAAWEAVAKLAQDLAVPGWDCEEAIRLPVAATVYQTSNGSWVLAQEPSPGRLHVAAWSSPPVIGCLARLALDRGAPSRRLMTGTLVGEGSMDWVACPRRAPSALAQIAVAVAQGSAAASQEQKKLVGELAKRECRAESARGHKAQRASSPAACGLSDGWLRLGPWPAGKLELDGDPGHAIVALTAARGRHVALGYSEVSRDGSARWGLAETRGEHAEDEASTMDMQAGSTEALPAALSSTVSVTVVPEGVDWSRLVQSLGTQASLEVQSWVIGTFTLLQPSVVELSCVGPSLVWVASPGESRVPVVGDVYHAHNSRWIGRLAAGPHEIQTRLRGRVQLSAKCSIRTWADGAHPTLVLPRSNPLVHSPDALRVEGHSVLAGAWMALRVHPGPDPVVVRSSQVRLSSLTGEVAWEAPMVRWDASLRHSLVLPVPIVPNASVVWSQVSPGTLRSSSAADVFEAHLQSRGAARLLSGASSIEAEESLARVPRERVVHVPGEICTGTVESAFVEVELRGCIGPCEGESSSETLLGVARSSLRCRQDAQSVQATWIGSDASVHSGSFVLPRALVCSVPSTCSVPLLVSQHGTGVSASSQADAYKQGGNNGFVFGLDEFVVIAPSRHGAHNWEGAVGYGAVSSAVANLPAIVNQLTSSARTSALCTSGSYARLRCTPPIDPHRIVWAGHSMGGHGAWVSLSKAPNRALCSWPAAGWLNKEAYGDANSLLGVADVSEVALERADSSLRGLLHALMSPNRATALAALPASEIPTRLRVGTHDAVVHPWYARRGARAVEVARLRTMRALEARGWNTSVFAPHLRRSSMLELEHVDGKEHWFWDTSSPNDGGVLADPSTREFFRACASRTTDDDGRLNALRRMVPLGAVEGRLRFPVGSPAAAPPMAVLDVFSVTSGSEMDHEGRRGLFITERTHLGRVGAITVAVTLEAIDASGNAVVGWRILQQQGVRSFEVDMVTAPHGPMVITTQDLPAFDEARFAPPHVVFGLASQVVASADELPNDQRTVKTVPIGKTTSPVPLPSDLWRRPVVVVVGTVGVPPRELATRRALAGYLASTSSITHHGYVQVFDDEETAQILPHWSVVAIGGAESNAWLNRSGINASLLTSGCQHYEHSGITGLSMGTRVTGEWRAPVMVLQDQGMGWEGHVILGTPTVPPMTRASWSNGIPPVVRASGELFAIGDAAWFYAGFRAASDSGSFFDSLVNQCADS
jgi:hypothetical protein